jgi:hypothetical protein
MVNKIVIRYANGKIWKGTKEDFFPYKDILHFSDKDNGGDHEINIKDLKAVFFVKTFKGNPNYHEKYDLHKIGSGKKIMVHFKDTEKMVGYFHRYSPTKTGFILIPADPDCNNEKVFVIIAATDKIYFI